MADRRRVLVTGADGLVGAELVERLAARPDLRVVASGRRARGVEPASVDRLVADLSGPGAGRSLVESAEPDVVVHCAAMSRVDDCEEHPEESRHINVDLVGELAAACRERSARLIHLSTDFVFDGVNGPYREEDVPRPINRYGEHKLAAERLVLAGGGRGAAVVRTVLVLGTPRSPGRSNLLTWVVESLRARKAIRVVRDQWRTPTWVADLARGLEAMIEREVDGVWHLSGDELVTVHDLALRVARVFELDAALISPVDSATLREAGRRPPRTGFIVDRARRELGFVPTALERALREMRLEATRLQERVS